MTRCRPATISRPTVAGQRRSRAGRRHHQDGSGATFVEFAIIAPISFLLMLSIVIVGIVVTNYIQLTNLARDGARVAAICGSAAGTPMPDGSGACTGTAVATYITNHLVALPAGSVTPQIFVCSPSQSSTCSTTGTACGSSGSICQCQTGKIVEVDMAYDQPLYLPVLSTFLQTSSNGTRHLSASAQATCEQ